MDYVIGVQLMRTKSKPGLPDNRPQIVKILVALR
jgi:hypothetical protein